MHNKTNYQIKKQEWNWATSYCEFGISGLRLEPSSVNSSLSERHSGVRLKLAFLPDINRIHAQ